MSDRIYGVYYDRGGERFLDKLVTEAFRKRKVEPRAYILTPDKSGSMRVTVTSIEGGKEVEKRLSEAKEVFEVYYVRNIKDNACIEFKNYVFGKLVELRIVIVNKDCIADLIRSRSGRLIIQDYPEGCFKRLNPSLSQFVRKELQI